MLDTIFSSSFLAKSVWLGIKRGVGKGGSSVDIGGPSGFSEV